MEVVFRAAITFCFLWFITRVIGKRELGQLTAFELVLLVTMGDLVQQGVTQEDYSVTGSILAVGTFTLMMVTLSYVSWRFPRTRTSIEGIPVLVIRDGKSLTEVLRQERLSTIDLDEALREQGIEDIRKVSVGVLEPDGRFSFITGSDQPANTDKRVQ